MTIAKVRITSSVITDDVIFSRLYEMIAYLHRYDGSLNIEVIERRKQTINGLFKYDNTPLIVITKDVPVVYYSPQQKLFYHENTARFKLKRLKKNGEIPPLISALLKSVNDPENLDAHIYISEGMMGVGNDLMLIINAMPNAIVDTYERDLLTFIIISSGIMYYYDKDVTSRIHFNYGSVETYLENITQTHTLYLDPMFNESIEQNSGIQVLTEYASSTEKSVLHTLINSSKSAVLKAPTNSSLFKELNLKTCVRKSATTQFGIKKP